MKSIAASFLLIGCLFLGGCMSKTGNITNLEVCVGEQAAAPGEDMLRWREVIEDNWVYGGIIITLDALVFVGPVGNEYQFRVESDKSSHYWKYGSSSDFEEQTFHEAEEISYREVTIRLGGLNEEGGLRYWVEEGCLLDDNPWVEVIAAADQVGYEGPLNCDLPFSLASQLSTEIQIAIFDACISSSTNSPMWTCLAANAGHKDAQPLLASFYRREWRELDLVRSYAWYTIAGTEHAMERREDLAQQMTPDQIAEAERLVGEWEPNPAECETIRPQAED